MTLASSRVTLPLRSPRLCRVAPRVRRSGSDSLSSGKFANGKYDYFYARIVALLRDGVQKIVKLFCDPERDRYVLSFARLQFVSCCGWHSTLYIRRVYHSVKVFPVSIS